MSIPPTVSQPKPVRALGPALVIILILIAALLGYYQLVYYPPNHTSTTSTIAATDPFSINVTILPGAAAGPRDKTFVPNTITVVIGYNATVNWYNNDTGVLHTVSANASDVSIDPVFSAWGSGGNNIQYGATLQYTFTKPGTYGYYCAIHPLTMAGTVVVVAGSNSSSGTTPVVSSSLTSTSASIFFSGIQHSGSAALDSFRTAATTFASDLATLTGSGTAPWRVNLSRILPV